MKMDERYSSASYGSAGLAAFFASLSLQDWASLSVSRSALSSVCLHTGSINASR